MKRPTFLVILLFLIPAVCRAAGEPVSSRTLDFSIGAFALDEDGGIRSRLNEYRDVGDAGPALFSLSLSNFENPNAAYVINLKNPGYQDSSLGFYMNRPGRYTFRHRFDKTPHYVDARSSTGRDRYFTELTAAPLAPLNGSISYFYEEKGGNLSPAQPADQKVDEIKFSLDGAARNVSAGLFLTDSKMEHPYAGYEADGIGLSIAGADPGLKCVNSLYLDKKDYDSNRSTLLPGTLKVERVFYDGRYEVFDYFHLNASVSSVNTDNSNAGTLSFDRESYRLGFDLKTSYLRLGYNFINTEVGYNGAEVEKKETDSHEVYLKGRLARGATVRADYGTETRNTGGVKTNTLSNSEQLAARKNSASLKLSFVPAPNLLVSGEIADKTSRFERVSQMGVEDQSFFSQIITFQYQPGGRFTYFGSHYYQRNLFRGYAPSAAGGLTVYNPFRVAEDNGAYLLGLSVSLNARAGLELSYSQSTSRIGDYLETDRISERNVTLAWNYGLRNGLDLKVSYVHNGYFQRLDPGVSGVSDYFDVGLSGRTTF
ncbi:MAG: hypothetical protein AB1742_02505 [bacterium]